MHYNRFKPALIIPFFAFQVLMGCLFKNNPEVKTRFTIPLKEEETSMDSIVLTVYLDTAGTIPFQTLSEKINGRDEVTFEIKGNPGNEFLFEAKIYKNHQIESRFGQIVINGREVGKAQPKASSIRIITNGSGSTTPSGEQFVRHGDSLQIEFEAEWGFMIESIKVNGKIDSTAMRYKKLNLVGGDTDYVVKASFNRFIGKVVMQGDTNSYINDALADNNKGIVAVGVKSSGSGQDSIYLVKRHRELGQVWDKFLGDLPSQGALDISHSVKGGYIVSGFAKLEGRTDEDMYVIHVDNDGNVIWKNVYGGSGRDFANETVMDNHGNFFTVGTRNGNRDEGLIYLVKTDPLGTKVWEQIYSETTTFPSIEVTTENEALVCAHWEDDNNRKFLMLRKIDSVGSISWDSTYKEVPMNTCHDILRTENGNFIYLGGSESAISPSYTLGKMDPEGNFLWKTKVEVKDPASAGELYETENGPFLITTIMENIPLVLSFSEDGRLNWQKRFELDDGVTPTKMVPGLVDGYLVTGVSEENAPVIYKMDAEGRYQ